MRTVKGERTDVQPAPRRAVVDLIRTAAEYAQRQVQARGLYLTPQQQREWARSAALKYIPDVTDEEIRLALDE